MVVGLRKKGESDEEIRERRKRERERERERESQTKRMKGEERNEEIN